jgi:hypothetical protein
LNQLSVVFIIRQPISCDKGQKNTLFSFGRSF